MRCQAGPGVPAGSFSDRETSVQIGANFPQHEIGTDPGAIREFAQAAEALGYVHLTALDHVLGVDLPSHPGYEPIKNVSPRYALTYPIHELFTLFGFLAGVTEKIELFTAILILPQRQTALVAKQAAEVDILSNGRLRLGVAVGHTDIEYAGLGMSFHDRGARIEEQIELLRKLWTEEVVTFNGKFHNLEAVGINPLPVQRPIPIWMGGWSQAVLRRAARLADGLMTPQRIGEMRGYVSEAGRDPSKFGFSVGIRVRGDDVSGAVAEARTQEARGVTHLAVGTQDAGLTSVDEHIDALRRFKAEYGF
jgi:probable F420-dependent oxidoreductase